MNSMNSVNSVNSEQAVYSAVLPPSLMVFFSFEFVSILIYIDSFIVVEARICQWFISISNCETFSNYHMYHLKVFTTNIMFE